MRSALKEVESGGYGIALGTLRDRDARCDPKPIELALPICLGGTGNAAPTVRPRVAGGGVGRYRLSR